MSFSFKDKPGDQQHNACASDIQDKEVLLDNVSSVVSDFSSVEHHKLSYDKVESSDHKKTEDDRLQFKDSFIHSENSSKKSILRHITDWFNSLFGCPSGYFFAGMFVGGITVSLGVIKLLAAASS